VITSGVVWPITASCILVPGTVLVLSTGAGREKLTQVPWNKHNVYGACLHSRLDIFLFPFALSFPQMFIGNSCTGMTACQAVKGRSVPAPVWVALPLRYVTVCWLGGGGFSHIKQEEGPPTVTVVSSTRFRPTRLCPGIHLPANILGHGRHTMPSRALPVRETHACFPSTSYDS